MTAAAVAAAWTWKRLLLWYQVSSKTAAAPAAAAALFQSIVASCLQVAEGPSCQVLWCCLVLKSCQVQTPADICCLPLIHALLLALMVQETRGGAARLRCRLPVVPLMLAAHSAALCWSRALQVAAVWAHQAL